MSEQLGNLDLAALISSRICHDVINPVGAISNGLEMLAEEPDEEMRVQAMELIRNSARQAAAKLQFARLAFGAAGSAGAEIDLRDAEKVSRDFVQSAKHSLEWKGMAATLPKNKVKLLLNLVALGVVALPRGGVKSWASRRTWPSPLPPRARRQSLTSMSRDCWRARMGHQSIRTRSSLITPTWSLKRRALG